MLAVALPENSATVNAVAELVVDAVGGTVSKIGYNGNVLVSELIADVKAIVDSFGVENAVVDAVFEELIALYEGVILEKIA